MRLRFMKKSKISGIYACWNINRNSIKGIGRKNRNCLLRKKRKELTRKIFRILRI
jgi:hypothetical protein